MRRIVLALAVVATACHAESDGPPCGAVAGQFFTLAQRRIGSAAVELRLARAVVEQLPAMRDSLAIACSDGAWSPAVRTCMVAAPDHAAFQACEQPAHRRPAQGPRPTLPTAKQTPSASDNRGKNEQQSDGDRLSVLALRPGCAVATARSSGTYLVESPRHQGDVGRRQARRFAGKYLVVKIDGELTLGDGHARFRGEDPGFLWRNRAKDYIQSKLAKYLDPKTVAVAALPTWRTASDPASRAAWRNAIATARSASAGRMPWRSRRRCRRSMMLHSDRSFGAFMGILTCDGGCRSNNVVAAAIPSELHALS